jgi:hypothetical protein
MLEAERYHKSFGEIKLREGIGLGEVLTIVIVLVPAEREATSIEKERHFSLI